MSHWRFVFLVGLGAVGAAIAPRLVPVAPPPVVAAPGRESPPDPLLELRGEVDRRLDALDGRLGAVDARIDVLDGRIDAVIERLVALEQLRAARAAVPAPPPPARAGACPDGTVRLPNTRTCVARFEMKQGPDGVVSRPEGLPLSVGRDEAVRRCEALGPGWHLLTNAEWQALAHDIERTGANWSGGAPGVGTLNIGNSGPAPAAADVVSPTEFVRLRAHVLSTGETIWDLGGNVQEWVADEVGVEVPDAGRGSPCDATGAAAAAYGPADPATCGAWAGCLEGSGGRVVFRGGGAGMDSGPWQGCKGLYTANTNSFWDAERAGPGFRCAFTAE